MNNKYLRQYLRRVRSLLPCSGREKRAFLNQLRSDVSAYLEALPKAGYDAICERFGSPAVIAAAHLETIDTPMLLKKLRLRNRITAVVTASLILALIATSITYAWELRLLSDMKNGWIEERIVSYPAVVIDEESGAVIDEGSGEVVEKVIRYSVQNLEDIK